MTCQSQNYKVCLKNKIRCLNFNWQFREIMLFDFIFIQELQNLLLINFGLNLFFPCQLKCNCDETVNHYSKKDCCEVKDRVLLIFFIMIMESFKKVDYAHHWGSYAWVKKDEYRSTNKLTFLLLLVSKIELKQVLLNCLLIISLCKELFDKFCFTTYKSKYCSNERSDIQ